MTSLSLTRQVAPNQSADVSAHSKAGKSAIGNSAHEGRSSLNWINIAFFRLNAVISMVFLIVTAAEAVFRGGFGLR